MAAVRSQPDRGKKKTYNDDIWVSSQVNSSQVKQPTKFLSKKREYAERILKIEHGSFTPLVFSSLGGMSVECTHFYNRLADKISEKRNISVSKGRAWIRTKLSFSLLRSTNLCIRGSRTRTQFGPTAMADTNIEMALSMARIED